MTPKHITDEQIVQWVQEGLLEVRYPQSLEPQLWFRGRQIKAEITVQRGRYRVEECGERFTWSIRFKGKRRKIVRSKLVWMTCHRRVIPEGHTIHHKSENRFDDRIDNLECLNNDVHKSIHCGLEY